MRRLAVILSAALASAGCQTHGSPVHLSALHGTALDGTTVGPTQTAARVLVLNFFGSWCPPCRAEEDGFATLADAYRSEGVAFVGVAERETSQVNLRAFLSAHHVHYPVLDDDGAQLELRVAPQVGIPTTLVFRSGRLLRRLFGAVDYTQLRDVIKAALAK